MARLLVGCAYGAYGTGSGAPVAAPLRHPAVSRLAVHAVGRGAEAWNASCRLAAGVAAGTLAAGAGFALRRSSRLGGRRRPARGPAVAVGAAASAAETLEELKGLRVRELRKRLESAGVSTRGCFDKESLMDLLKEEWVVERVASAAAGPAGAAEFVLHMVKSADQYGIQADDDSYVAIDLMVGPSAKPARFVIDTGASHTVVKDFDARNLGAIDINPGMSVSAQGGTGVQMGGMRMVGLGRASLGGLDCGEFSAVATQGGLPVPFECCGLLGLDFLARFHWELDVPARKARAVPISSSGRTPFDTAGLLPVPMQPLRAATGFELLAAPLRLRSAAASGGASARCLAVVDLGAPTTVCSQATATALGLNDSDLRSTGQVVSGMDGNPMFVREATLALSVGEGPSGPIELQAEVIVGDLPAFQMLGLTSSAPVAIIGLDVLGRSRMLVSPATSEMWMAP